MKQRRKSLDLTQEELACKVGCSVSALQKFETNARKPSRQVAMLLACALEIPAGRKDAFVTYARSGSSEHSPSLFRPPNNLPAQVTPFIGRAREQAALTRMLVGEARLVTLVGPPGVGKTRLAQAAAAQLLDCFDDGVFFIPLSHIRDPSLLAAAISDSLKLYHSGLRPLYAQLLGHLSDKMMLLVLDNFEQIIEAASQVAEMLGRCPWLKILVTSRRGLHIRAERRFSVPPLALPDLDWPVKLQRLAQTAAVELFLDRAQAVEPEFQLSETNALPVAQICHHLDGLPLAIQLIAPRVQYFPPHELLHNLTRSMLLHSDGFRDLEERQHTLFKAIQWSSSMLLPREQTFLALLSVFHGGWTEEAAQHIWSRFESKDEISTTPPIIADGASTSSVADMQQALLNSSLIVLAKGIGETRYSMLETIREFGIELLKVRGELTRARELHADYFLSFMRYSDTLLCMNLRLLDSIEHELANLRAALHFLIEFGEIEKAIRLGTGMASFCTFRTRYLSEGRGWMERLISLMDDRSVPIRLKAWVFNQAGFVAYLQSDFVTSQAWHAAALSISRSNHLGSALAQALFGLSNIAMNKLEYEEVKSLLKECLPAANSANETMVVVLAMNNLAEIARVQGDIEKAQALFQEVLEMMNKLQYQVLSSIVLDNLGSIMQAKGDYKAALEYHQRCLKVSFAAGDFRHTALSMEKLAGVAAALGKELEAARLLGAAESLRTRIGSAMEAIDRPEYKSILSKASSHLSESSFLTAWEEGQSYSLQEAVDLALENIN